jgi:hypothetical protein
MNLENESELDLNEDKAKNGRNAISIKNLEMQSASRMLKCNQHQEP